MKFYLLHSSHTHDYLSTRLRIVLICLLSLFGSSLQAQTYLSFNRIGVNWPQITLYLNVKCNDTVRYNLKKENFQIKENGRPITDFELYCPDPRTHCPASIGIGIDNSSSIIGFLDTAKAYAKALVSMLDGIVDESAIMSMSEKMKLETPLATDTSYLNSIIDQIQLDGKSALWDATHELIKHTSSFGINERRAIILITDGNSIADKLHNLDDIILYAIANKISVFTIGVGSAPNDQNLSRIAYETGGRYYLLPYIYEVKLLIQEITAILYGFYECELSYISACEDGQRREVELTLSTCGSSDTKKKTYKAPKDSINNQQIIFTLDTVKIFHHTSFVLPLRILSSILLPASPFQFKLQYDTTLLRLQDVTFGEGIRKDSTFWELTSSGVQIQSKVKSYFKTADTLFQFYFDDLSDASIKNIPVSISDWEFTGGCIQPILSDAVIRFINHEPVLTASMTSPASLSFDAGRNSYFPDSCIIQTTFINRGDADAINGVITLIYDSSTFTLLSPSITQTIQPSNISANGGAATVHWILSPKRSLQKKEYQFTSIATFDNHTSITSSTQTKVISFAPIVSCALQFFALGYDTLSRENYFEGRLGATFTSMNGFPADSVFVSIDLPEPLHLMYQDSLKKISMIDHVQSDGYRTVFWYISAPQHLSTTPMNIRVCSWSRVVERTCCESKFLELAPNQVAVDISAPDSLTVLEPIHKYYPGTFDVKVFVKNIGYRAIDSLNAEINIYSPLYLATSLQPTMRPIIPEHLNVFGEDSNTGTTSWRVGAIEQSIAQNVQGVIYIHGSWQRSSIGISPFTIFLPAVTTTEVKKEFVAEDIQLFQNYPNPISREQPSTTIQFYIPSSLSNYSSINLKLYDVFGRLISELFNDNVIAGLHCIPYDTKNLLDGMYVYRLSMGNKTVSRVMIISR